MVTVNRAVWRETVLEEGEEGDGFVSARGSVVYGSDVEGDGVGGLIGVLSAIGGAAVIGDLEVDGGVVVAIGVCCRSEDEIADLTDSNDIPV